MAHFSGIAEFEEPEVTSYQAPQRILAIIVQVKGSLL